MTVEALSLQFDRLIAGGTWVSPLTALIGAFVFGQVLAWMDKMHPELLREIADKKVIAKDEKNDAGKVVKKKLEGKLVAPPDVIEAYLGAAAGAA